MNKNKTELTTKYNKLINNYTIFTNELNTYIEILNKNREKLQKDIDITDNKYNKYMEIYDKFENELRQLTLTKSKI